MGIEEGLKELHNYGMIAARILGKPENEPRTNYKILPTGKAVVVFYSTCFSFIPRNTNQIVFEITELEDYIQKARQEVELYETVRARPGAVVSSFKPKADVIPFIICAGGTKRIYKFHLCKDHRRDLLKYKPSCKCYLTYEDF